MPSPSTQRGCAAGPGGARPPVRAGARLRAPRLVAPRAGTTCPTCCRSRAATRRWRPHLRRTSSRCRRRSAGRIALENPSHYLALDGHDLERDRLPGRARAPHRLRACCSTSTTSTSARATLGYRRRRPTSTPSRPSWSCEIHLAGHRARSARSATRAPRSTRTTRRSPTAVWALFERFVDRAGAAADADRARRRRCRRSPSCSASEREAARPAAPRPWSRPERRRHGFARCDRSDAFQRDFAAALLGAATTRSWPRARRRSRASPSTATPCCAAAIDALRGQLPDRATAGRRRLVRRGRRRASFARQPAARRQPRRATATASPSSSPRFAPARRARPTCAGVAAPRLGLDRVAPRRRRAGAASARRSPALRPRSLLDGRARAAPGGALAVGSPACRSFTIWRRERERAPLDDAARLAAATAALLTRPDGERRLAADRRAAAAAFLDACARGPARRDDAAREPCPADVAAGIDSWLRCRRLRRPAPSPASTDDRRDRARFASAGTAVADAPRALDRARPGAARQPDSAIGAVFFLSGADQGRAACSTVTDRRGRAVPRRVPAAARRPGARRARRGVRRARCCRSCSCSASARGSSALGAARR